MTRWERSRDRVTTLLALVTACAGLWSIVWSFSPGQDDVPSFDVVFQSVGLVTGPSIFLGLLLLAIAGGLLRRMRAALVLVIAMQVLSLASVAFTLALQASADPAELADLPEDLFRSMSILGGCILAAMVVTVWLWPYIRVRGVARVRWAAVTLFGGLITSAVVAFALTSVWHEDLVDVAVRLKWSAGAALGSPAAFTDPSVVGLGWVATTADIVSAVALVLAGFVLLRSPRIRPGIDADDELAVRRLLLSHGEADSLGYFATRRDKSVVLSSDGRAAITYRVEVSVCVASADPVGDPAAWPEAISAWLALCARHGWFPAALSTSTAGAKAYVAAGLKAIAMGDEAVVRVDRFAVNSPRMQPVRRAVRRLERAGATTSVRRQNEIPAAELEQLAGLAEAWRSNDTERGFSMALDRFGDPTDARNVVVTAYDSAGTPIGLLSFVPWGRGGLSLDLMRRSADADNGITEFMIAALIAAADAMGVRRISLNFAMFRHVFAEADEVGAGPITRLVDRALSLASRFWQLESLLRANEKYDPDWHPRYLCYDSSLTFTRAALAAGVAEGFLPRPSAPRGWRHRSGGPQDASREVAFAAAVAEQEAAAATAPPAPVRLTEQQRWRRVKLQRLRDAGYEAYPVRVPKDSSIADVLAVLSGAPSAERSLSVTGRVRAIRDFGGVTFAVLQDEGRRLQVVLSADRTPAAAHELFRRVVDLGDHVSVTGPPGYSRSGEPSLLVDSWVMAAKALRPVTGLGARFSDPEARARDRCLDVVVNLDALELLQQRSAAVAAIRAGFVARGFTEVETPMLQAIHGGATARPFRTFINAYAMRLYLRIAPELFLKRLAVGGMPKIFELGRNFRNEGADATHNPEFTSIEAYQAYADYDDMRILTRDLILEAAVAVHGEPIALRPNDVGGVDRVRLDGEWPVVPVHAAVSRATGTTLTSASTLADVVSVCRAHGVHVDPDATAGELVLELYDALVEKQTVLPTFYTDFPVETSPLTRVHRADPRLSERWDLVAFGAELGTAYSELVDPIDQRERLTAQSVAAARGDLEAMQLDESFLEALELGMPPTGGLGIGVDRVVMMLVGANIRATLAFPFVRPN